MTHTPHWLTRGTAHSGDPGCQVNGEPLRPGQGGHQPVQCVQACCAQQLHRRGHMVMRSHRKWAGSGSLTVLPRAIILRMPSQSSFKCWK